jgi:hypothetical protein
LDLRSREEARERGVGEGGRVEESGGSVGIRGGGSGRGGGVRQVGRPGMVPGRGGGGRELLGAGSLGGGGLGNSYASEATKVAAALAGKYLTAESDEAKSEADKLARWEKRMRTGR